MGRTKETHFSNKKTSQLETIFNTVRDRFRNTRALKMVDHQLRAYTNISRGVQCPQNNKKTIDIDSHCLYVSSSNRMKGCLDSNKQID